MLAFGETNFPAPPVVTVVGARMHQALTAFAAEPVDQPSDQPGNRPFVLRPPRWMQPAVVSVASGAGGCGLAAYVPSSLLTGNAEDRRRVLFPYVQAAACRAGLPVGLLDATLIQESGYNPAALSPKGAFGLGQLMPATARQLGVDAYDIRQNLDGAARYLAQQLQEFGSPHLALAAYNAGPERVRRSQGVPNITETRAYVSAILRNWSHLEARRRLFS